MNFNYEELREIHLALTEGRWLNQSVKDSAIKKVESNIMLTKPNTSKADVEASYTYACKMREADKAYDLWWARANDLEKQLTALEQMA